MQIVRDWIRIVTVVLSFGLTSCGGGAGSDPGVSARAGSSDIAAAGGSVDAVLAGGATVRLEVPAGTLVATTTFRIDPLVAPSGTLGSFKLSPAGILLLKPVTLTVTLPAGGTPDPDTVLVLDTGTRKVPLSAPIDAAARTITVELPLLGAPAPVAAAGAGRAHAMATSVDTQSLVLLLEHDPFLLRVELLKVVVGDLQGDGSVQNAANVQLAMASLLGLPAANTNADIRDGISAWRDVVCAQQVHFVSALDGFSGVDLPTFAQRASDVLIWDRFAQDLNETVAKVSAPPEAGCPNIPADFAQPVRDRLPAFLAAVASALNSLDPLAEFNQILAARIPELLKLEAVLQGTDLPASVLPLAAEQTVRLRTAAYGACRTGLDQTLQRSLLVKEIGDIGFLAASPYAEADLLQDIQFCGMPVHWKMLNAQGLVLQQGEAGGVSAGVTAQSATLRLSGAATIRFSGPLASLICPVSSQNNEQFVVSAGPAGGPFTAVKQLTPSNGNRYLESSTLDIDVATLKAQGAQRLVVARQGGVCSGDFPNLSAHATLATFLLDASTTMQITAANLPGAVAGAFYTASLAVTGGTAPFAWAVTGLPAGLNVNAQTGEISGTPTELGAFANLAVSVTDANGLSAAGSIPKLPVVPNVAGQYTGQISRSILTITTFGRTKHFETATATVVQSGDQVSGDIVGVAQSLDSGDPAVTATPIPNDSAHSLHFTATLLFNGKMTNVQAQGTQPGCPGFAALELFEFGIISPPLVNSLGFRGTEADCHQVTKPGFILRLEGGLLPN